MNRLLIACLSFFAVSTVMAQPEGVPPGPPSVEVTGTVDANVVNTVDANVVNTIPFDSLLENVRFIGGVAGGGNLFVELPQGKLHAISLTVAPNTPGDRCDLLTVIEVTVSGDTTERPVGAGVMSLGAPVAITQNYATPIEVLFDPATSAAELQVKVIGSAFCNINFSAAYEVLDANGNLALGAMRLAK